MQQDNMTTFTWRTTDNSNAHTHKHITILQKPKNSGHGSMNTEEPSGIYKHIGQFCYIACCIINNFFHCGISNIRLVQSNQKELQEGKGQTICSTIVIASRLKMCCFSKSIQIALILFHKKLYRPGNL